MDALIRAMSCRKCERANSRQDDTLSKSISTLTYDAATVDLGKSTPNEVNGNEVDVHGRHNSRASVNPGLIVVAIYDYNPTYQGDVQFNKGDRMLVLDKSNDDWWKAIHLRTKHKGPIPSNYVAQADTLDCEEWYHGVLSRKDAEKLLRNSSKEQGTFLIRESERANGSYALSILILNTKTNKYQTKHYVITIGTGKYFIKEERSFHSLQELVTYYSESAHGLITKLNRPCPKVQPKRWDLSSQTKNNWEMSRTDFEKVKRLAQGSFGEVWLGRWVGSEDVAIKSLKPGTMSREAFLQEAAIMKTLHHEKLVSLYAVCSEVDPIWIITEYMPHGSVLDYLRSEGTKLNSDILIDMAAQVAFGMTYLESRQLIHRDLAARNLLVGDNHLIKIADFGLARLIEEGIYLATKGTKFPIKWTAPEVFLYNRFSIKSDVWSFGIVLMEIVTYGEIPYTGLCNSDVQEKVLQGYRMPKPADHECSDEVYDLMKQCWQEEASQRPNFKYLHHSLDDILVNRP